MFPATEKLSLNNKLNVVLFLDKYLFGSTLYTAGTWLEYVSGYWSTSLLDRLVYHSRYYHFDYIINVTRS